MYCISFVLLHTEYYQQYHAHFKSSTTAAASAHSLSGNSDIFSEHPVVILSLMLTILAIGQLVLISLLCCIPKSPLRKLWISCWSKGKPTAKGETIESNQTSIDLPMQESGRGGFDSDSAERTQLMHETSLSTPNGTVFLMWTKNVPLILQGYLLGTLQYLQYSLSILGHMQCVKGCNVFQTCW